MSLKTYIFIFTLIIFANSKPKFYELENYEFEDYIQDFNKSYEQEFDIKKQIFEENLREIKIHNSNPDFSWKKGVNKFSDLTKEEF